MPSFTTKQARTPEEIQQSRDIRFAVFIDEQVSPPLPRAPAGVLECTSWGWAGRPACTPLTRAETDARRNLTQTSRSMSESLCCRSTQSRPQQLLY